jgi:anti-sigma B factor antagonist
MSNAGGNGRMTMEMTVQESDTTLVILRGRLNNETAESIERRCIGLATSRKPMVIDLSGVSYIASMGLRMLLLVAKAIAAQGGKIALMAPAPEVASVLRTAGIDRAIPVRASLDDARSAFARP